MQTNVISRGLPAIGSTENRARQWHHRTRPVPKFPNESETHPQLAYHDGSQIHEASDYLTDKLSERAR